MTGDFRCLPFFLCWESEIRTIFLRWPEVPTKSLVDPCLSDWGFFHNSSQGIWMFRAIFNAYVSDSLIIAFQLFFCGIFNYHLTSSYHMHSQMIFLLSNLNWVVFSNIFKFSPQFGEMIQFDWSNIRFFSLDWFHKFTLTQTVAKNLFAGGDQFRGWFNHQLPRAEFSGQLFRRFAGELDEAILQPETGRNQFLLKNH